MVCSFDVICNIIVHIVVYKKKFNKKRTKKCNSAHNNFNFHHNTTLNPPKQPPTSHLQTNSIRKILYFRLLHNLFPNFLQKHYFTFKYSNYSHSRPPNSLLSLLKTLQKKNLKQPPIQQKPPSIRLLLHRTQTQNLLLGLHSHDSSKNLLVYFRYFF